MATLDQRYGQLWWNPETGAVQDDRPGFAAPAEPVRDFLEGSTNLYRDEQGVIHNLRTSEAAPSPAAAAPSFAMSPLAARYVESQRAGGAGLSDPFGIARAAYASELNAAEKRAYETANWLSSFLPPERVAPETKRLTGIDLSDRLASTPNLLKRTSEEAGIAKTRAETVETQEDVRKKREDARLAPIEEFKRTASTVGSLNDLETAAFRVLHHAGLDRATGPIQGRVTSFTKLGADFDANLDALTNQIAVRAMQQVRDESKTGGAFGNVSDRDIELLKNSIAALKQSQSEAQLRQNIQTVIYHTNRIKGLAEQGYRAKYGESAQPLPQPEHAQLPVALRQQMSKYPEGTVIPMKTGEEFVIRNGQPVRIK
jgi:hypothetical protein